MANDKDFILKNAVEVGGPTNVTLGTITGNAVNLSTGNYFKDTLAANTTYTISNAGAVQSFQLEVTGASTYTITWPTSIEWAGGVAPAAPANGETDIFTFSTDDGGTSYIGTKTADNLS
jgi:hypothetical protein